VVLASRPQSATSLEISPEEDRRARIIKYSVAQGVRVICIILAVVGGGNWLTWVAGFGAAVLPYVAVVIANATGTGSTSKKVAKAEAPTIAISADAFRSAPKSEATDE
jgi:Protein of unknown function (DUF3099)